MNSLLNWLLKKFSKPRSVIETLKEQARLHSVSQQQALDNAVDKMHQPLDIADLKHFIPLRDLDDFTLASLVHARVRIKQGAKLFEKGEQSGSIFYLRKGSLVMQPNSGCSYQISENSTRARFPLNSHSVYSATAIALTDSELLEISAEINRLWANKSHHDETVFELPDIDLPVTLLEKPFFRDCLLAFRENRLSLPSLPDVALKLKDAMKSDIDIKQAADIISMDPRMVTKLIQVSNNAIYATNTPSTNCQAAIARIGLNATRNLVFSLSMNNLFHSNNPELMAGMRALWKKCVHISSLCFVLAEEFEDINPDDALLAGLVSEIGAIPIIHFAEHYWDEVPSFQEIQHALPYFRAAVGALTLHQLGFPEAVCRIPYRAENWFYDSGSSVTVDDIVILATLHSYFGSGKARDLPYINTIPAYGKLKAGNLTPDFSLSVLQNAQSRIKAAIAMLS